VTTSKDGKARLWEALSGKAISESMKHDREVNSAQFSPDGQRVVTTSWDKTARLWDAVTNREIGEPMKHEHIVISAQFSPDGQRVVTASGTAQLWDSLTGKPLGEPMKHEGTVYSAQFSPDGQRVVTASDDKTARLWDAVTNREIGEPMKHEGTVYSAQFSPDSQRVVTASSDGTARLWDVPTVSSKDSVEDVLLLAELAEATSGVAMEMSGEIRNVLNPDQVKATRDKIAVKFPGLPASLTPLQRFLKWSVSEPRNRTVSPFSKLTVLEWVENRINEGTVDGLRAAMVVDPANARLAAHLGLRLADYALETETDPDAARRARAEADYQTRRALKLAPDNEEVKALRGEVVTRLQVSSE
jgi:dipeptidyl aminopeptidase/acylaminoacyl peptidase